MRGLDSLIFLPKVVQAFFFMVNEIQSWMDNAKRYPLLSKEHVLRLARTIQSPKSTEKARTRAINKIVVHNLRLVPKIVRQLTDNKCSYNYGDSNTLDLLQQGAIGLHRAAQGFDPSRGYEFSTYAMHWIRQSVRRYANNNYSPIRVPENTLRDYFYCKKINGIPQHLDKSHVLDRLADADAALHMNSLDAPPPTTANCDDEKDYHNLLCAKDDQEPEQPRMSFQQIVQDKGLSDIEIETLHKIFMESQQNIEIAKDAGVHHQTISFRKNSALRKLREKNIIVV